MLIRLFFLTVITLSLYADEADKSVYVYNCTSDYHFVAEVSDDKAWLFLPSKTIQVMRIESKEKTYEHDEVRFIPKGYKATLVENKKRYTCENDGIAATFEKAKLSGVAFRAIGNEPSWILEIVSEKEVVLITNLGESKIAFKVVETFSDDYSTEYKMLSQHNTMFVRIENRVCQDTMVERTYASTVYINFDGVNMQGCGKALY